MFLGIISAWVIYDPDSFMQRFQIGDFDLSDLYAIATFCMLYASIYISKCYIVIEMNLLFFFQNEFCLIFEWLFLATHVHIITVMYSQYKSMKHQQKHQVAT